MKDTFDLLRIKRFLDLNPQSNIIIIANKKDTAKIYWENIKGHLNLKNRPYIITNANTWDGLPFIDSLVLKIDRWWENRNAIEVMEQSRLAKFTLPITYIPPYSKGGE